MKTSLSNQELQVLKRFSAGRQRKQIARDLGIAENTVKAYATSMREKLGATNATHAVALAFRAGVLQ